MVFIHPRAACIPISPPGLPFAKFANTKYTTETSFVPSTSTSAYTTSTSFRQSSSLRRCFHASSSATFIPFFGLSRASKAPKHASDFLSSLSARNVPALVSSYRALRAALLSEPSLEPSSFLCHQDLFEALRLLSETSYIHTDYEALQDIFEDIKELWADNWTPEDHHSYLVGLVNSGRLEQAASWLQYMSTGLPERSKSSETRREEQIAKETPETSVPRTADWNIYLSGLRRCNIPHQSTNKKKSESYLYMKMIVLDRMRTGIRNTKTWNTLLATLFEHPQPGAENFEQVVLEVMLIRSRMAEDGCQEDLDTLCTLLGGFSKFGMFAAAADARSEIMMLERDQKITLDTRAWNILIRYAARSQDFQAGYTLLKEMIDSGIKPDQETFQTLLIESLGAEKLTQVTVQQMKSRLSDLERRTGVLVNHQLYTAAITRVTRFEDATQLYADMEKDGVPVSSDTIKALLLKGNAAEASGDIAAKDYHELLKTAYNDLLSSRMADQRNKHGLYDVALYAALLQFCARKDIADFQWAITLLEDVRANGLGLRSSQRQSFALNGTEKEDAIAASLVIALMRNAAKNHSEAFKAYSWTVAIDPNGIFTYDDFYNIIRAFSDLEFPSSSSRTGQRRSYCPPSVFFAFFEDMRRCGLPPGSKVFQAVLYYYAREGQSRASAEAVRQIHDLVKMDQYSDPDIGLMNRLMFAYSKTGNSAAALGVWRAVLVNRIPYNNVSVSIVLDTYGFSGAYQQLCNLWKGLKRQHFPLNKKNLESYLEALGRLGRPRQAIDVAFVEAMQSGGPIEIDERTFEVLLKFARADRELYEELRSRIEREYPHLWQRVQGVGSSLPAEQRGVRLLSEDNLTESNAGGGGFR